MLEIPIVTGSHLMLQALRDSDRIARTPVPILIEGESGTGKELLARRIHSRSLVERKLFVAVNCAALCENLAESELFGHVAGSFTGATRDRRGLFEEADGGSVFLDEIAELSLSLQAKLLRVLQEREVRRVGETKARPVRFRLISATNRELLKERIEGRFREDLFYRVHVVKIALPPLRERPDDVTLLVETLLDRIRRRFCKEIAGVGEDAIQRLRCYPWPGNVRELENELRRAAALVDEGEWIETRHFSETVRLNLCPSGFVPSTLHEKLTDLEKKEILKIMDRMDGNKTRAALALGLSRQGLKNKLSRYGLA